MPPWGKALEATSSANGVLEYVLTDLHQGAAHGN